MHITDWLEMLGEHFPLVVIGCAEALLAVVLLCAALRNRRQCADKNGAHSGGQKDVRNVVDKHGEHGNHLDGITGHGKNPFHIHCKVRGSGRQDCSGTATFLRPALSFALCLRYNEVQESYRDRETATQLCRKVFCAGMQGFSLCRSFAVCWCL